MPINLHFELTAEDMELLRKRLHSGEYIGVSLVDNILDHFQNKSPIKNIHFNKDAMIGMPLKEAMLVFENIKDLEVFLLCVDNKVIFISE